MVKKRALSNVLVYTQITGKLLLVFLTSIQFTRHRAFSFKMYATHERNCYSNARDQQKVLLIPIVAYYIRKH